MILTHDPAGRPASRPVLVPLHVWRLQPETPFQIVHVDLRRKRVQQRGEKKNRDRSRRNRSPLPTQGGLRSCRSADFLDPLRNLLRNKREHKGNEIGH
jgi:hypothetical protein